MVRLALYFSAAAAENGGWKINLKSSRKVRVQLLWTYECRLWAVRAQMIRVCYGYKGCKSCTVGLNVEYLQIKNCKEFRARSHMRNFLKQLSMTGPWYEHGYDSHCRFFIFSFVFVGSKGLSGCLRNAMYESGNMAYSSLLVQMLKTLVWTPTSQLIRYAVYQLKAFIFVLLLFFLCQWYPEGRLGAFLWNHLKGSSRGPRERICVMNMGSCRTLLPPSPLGFWSKALDVFWLLEISVIMFLTASIGLAAWLPRLKRKSCSCNIQVLSATYASVLQCHTKSSQGSGPGV